MANSVMVLQAGGSVPVKFLLYWYLQAGIVQMPMTGCAQLTAGMVCKCASRARANESRARMCMRRHQQPALRRSLAATCCFAHEAAAR
jgi:hypothetical protein